MLVCHSGSGGLLALISARSSGSVGVGKAWPGAAGIPEPAANWRGTARQGVLRSQAERIDGGDIIHRKRKWFALGPELRWEIGDGGGVAALSWSRAQHQDNYAPLMLRQKLAGIAIIMERTGGVLMMATPVIFSVTHSPAVLVAELVLGLGILASTVVIHTFTLPTEFDASFKRALPILESYLRPEDMPGARQVLKAAAFTYVASALVSILNIARWLRILRF